MNLRIFTLLVAISSLFANAGPLKGVETAQIAYASQQEVVFSHAGDEKFVVATAGAGPCVVLARKLLL